MFKKVILSMILTTLLVACGQDIEPEETNVEDNTSVEETQENAKEENTEEKDESSTSSQQEEENDTNSEDADSSKQPSATALDNLQVHFLDVGQSDATLFQYSDGSQNYNILFDTGDWRRNDVVNYLNTQNINHLDLVVASHPDADHIGQLAEIVNKFNVYEVWMSGNESSSQTFQRALEAILASDATYHEPRTGEEFAIGPMGIDVLYPSRITGNSNDESVSLKFTYGDVTFVLTGDAEKNAESNMLNSGIDIDADILQLGHHGSNTSSSSAFIQAVSPEVAIYSAGKDNSYGHPHAEVVNRIQNAGIKLYGTDVHGTIIVTTDGQDYSLQTNKDGTISPKSTGSTNSKSNNQESTNKQQSQKQPNAGACVDINSASVEEVQEIIHIGPTRAQELINLRPYSSIDSLTKINGIGPARIKDIKAQGIACVQ